MKFLNLALIFFICIYQKYISFLFTGSCRFTPSCSQYCKQAFEEFSFFKALCLSILRILRCNPFFEGYEDPINKGK